MDRRVKGKKKNKRDWIAVQGSGMTPIPKPMRTGFTGQLWRWALSFGHVQAKQMGFVLLIERRVESCGWGSWRER